jgi:hypothetical protein
MVIIPNAISNPLGGMGNDSKYENESIRGMVIILYAIQLNTN